MKSLWVKFKIHIIGFHIIHLMIPFQNKQLKRKLKKYIIKCNYLLINNNNFILSKNIIVKNMFIGSDLYVIQPVIHTINLTKSVVSNVRNNLVPIKKRKIKPLSENSNQSLKNDSGNWLDISIP